MRKTSIKTLSHFHSFFQNILSYISNMPENEINKVKSKLRSTCEKYSNIKVPHTHTKNLAYQKEITLFYWRRIMGRGEAVMDRSKIQ